MKYLKITNKGLIDIEAFTMIGASTKRNDNSKIGMFGSGNKYAIAYLLRNNFEVIVYSGLNKIEFKTEKRIFREMEFDLLFVNNKETSITLQMGFHWKLWQAIRELYTNAIDEGFISFELVEEINNFNNDETSIFISLNNDLEDLFFNKDEYFLNKERQPIFECKYGAIYEKTGSKARIYRKGIKVFETNKNSLFDYDLYSVVIDENRMASYSWQIPEHIWNILYSCDKTFVIRKILNEIKTNTLIEREIEEGIITPDISLMSTQWIEATEKRQVFSENFAGWLNDEEKIKTDFVPTKLYHTLTSKIGDSIKPKSVQYSENGVPYNDAVINDARANILSKALDFFNDVNFKMDYKIKIVDFKDTKILGSIDKENRLILVDVNAIDRGFDITVNTIIEEFIHLKHGVYDETRGFQDAIITEFIVYMKNNIK